MARKQTEYKRGYVDGYKKALADAIEMIDPTDELGKRRQQKQDEARYEKLRAECYEKYVRWLRL